MVKILLTGAGGFFNSRFYNYYKNKYDILPLKSSDLNVADREGVLTIVHDFKPDYILHAAALSSTNLCIEKPELAYSVNVEGSKNIASAALEVGARLINFSSEQLYNGNPEEGPYHEGILPKPNTVYGETKLQAEKEISKILDDAIILRFTWMFGFPEKGMPVRANVLWNILSAIFKGEKIKMAVNEYRGHTYVYEVIEQFERILSLPGGVYNTGSMNDLGTYDVACCVLKAMGLENRIDDILIRDEEKYSSKPRDIRILNNKLKSYGINFADTEAAIERAVYEFGYKLNF